MRGNLSIEINLRPWAEFGLSSWGAKQRKIKYRLCWPYDWTQKPGYSTIETFPCIAGLAPPLAPNKMIAGA